MQVLSSVWPVARHDGHSDHSSLSSALRITPGHLVAYGSGRAHFLPTSSNDLTTAAGADPDRTIKCCRDHVSWPAKYCESDLLPEYWYRALMSVKRLRITSC